MCTCTCIGCSVLHMELLHLGETSKDHKNSYAGEYRTNSIRQQVCEELDRCLRLPDLWALGQEGRGTEQGSVV